MSGKRYNKGKAPFDLIPKKALWELALLFLEGGRKYPDDRNWEEGLPYSTYISAIYRHLIKFECGEDIDGETRIHHLIAVAWNAICLYMTQHWVKIVGRLGIELDDRGINHMESFWKDEHFKSRPEKDSE